MMKFVKTLAAATLIAGSAVSASALAQENSREFSFTVERASLDSERGVRVAYQRLNAEAQRYCEALPFSIITTRGACQSDVVNRTDADYRITNRHTDELMSAIEVRSGKRVLIKAIEGVHLKALFPNSVQYFSLLRDMHHESIMAIRDYYWEQRNETRTGRLCCVIGYPWHGIL